MAKKNRRKNRYCCTCNHFIVDNDNSFSDDMLKLVTKHYYTMGWKVKKHGLCKLDNSVISKQPHCYTIVFENNWCEGYIAKKDGKKI